MTLKSIFAAICFLIFSLQLAVAQSFQFTITVGDGTNSQEITIGLDVNGSDSETDLDLIAPPPPPSGAFDARIKGSTTDYIRKIRNDSLRIARFEVSYAPATDFGPISIRWNQDNLPVNGVILLKDPFTGEFYNESLKQFEEIFIPAQTNASQYLERGLVFEFISEQLLPTQPEPTDPVDEVSNVGIQTVFRWKSSERVDSYTLQLAKDSLFVADLQVYSDIEDTVFTVPEELERNSTYFWRVSAMNSYADSDWSATQTFVTGVRTSIDPNALLPGEYQLEQNYPNPFNPSTQIRFALPQADEIRLEVYNLMGQRVATLTQGIKQAGWHQVEFDGSALASGVYVYRLSTASGFSQARRLMLVK